MWSRRFIVLFAAGMALAGVYRRALLDEVEGDLGSWEGFLLVWLPGALLLGLLIVFGWPWIVRLWNSRTRNR